MIQRSRIPALAMLLAFMLPVAAIAQTVTLSQGQTINVQMQDNVDSGNAYAGQHFTARVVGPFPNDDSTFANAVVNGTVIKVVSAGQGRNPELHFAWDSITLQNGTTYPINAVMTTGGPQQQNRNGGHVALTVDRRHARRQHNRQDDLSHRTRRPDRPHRRRIDWLQQEVEHRYETGHALPTDAHASADGPPPAGRPY